LIGGEGDDGLVGGPGHDRMFGNAGSDHFDAVDTYGDLLDGGDGEDFARISVGDRTLNIEHVQVRPPLGSTEDGVGEPTQTPLVADLLA
jgi:hypothetical protein